MLGEMTVGRMRKEKLRDWILQIPLVKNSEEDKLCVNAGDTDE